MHSHARQKNKQKNVMRTMCPNFDREDALDTVLEVPIPEEMFSDLGNSLAVRWQNMATRMKAPTPDKWSSPISAEGYKEMSFLLHVFRSPLLPFQVQEASTAKYIVQTYIPAAGGQPVLNVVNSRQVKISSSEFHHGNENLKGRHNQEAGGFTRKQIQIRKSRIDVEIRKKNDLYIRNT